MASSARAYALGRPALTRSQISSVPAVLAGVAILTIVGLAYLSQTSSVANTGYDIAALQAQREQWVRRNDQLRIDVAKAQSLAHVEREARTRLNMAPPRQVVFVAPPSSLGFRHRQMTRWKAGAWPRCLLQSLPSSSLLFARLVTDLRSRLESRPPTRHRTGQAS
jgi:cell division protein FtsB